MMDSVTKKDFMAQAEILEDRFAIDYMGKKEIIGWLDFDGGQIEFLRDEDNHAYIYAGGMWYSDDEITPARLRKADYIEISHACGWGFYIGRGMPASELAIAFENSVGHYIECGLEFGELVETEDGRIVKAG